MSSAIGMILGSELRRNRGAAALAILVAAVAGGAAMTAAAGARRSETAYPRFLEWSRHYDFGTGGAADDETLARDLAAIAGAPFVEQAARVPAADLLVRARDGRLLQPFQTAVVADPDEALARGVIAREKVLRGRRANPRSPEEATVSFATAERLGVDVGDRLSLVSPDPAVEGAEVRVVGVVVRAGEFPTLSGAATSSVVLTRAFTESRPELFSPGNDSLIVRVKPGVPGDEVDEWLRANVRGTDIFPVRAQDAAITRTIRVETVALWAVAALLGLVFLVLVGQVTYRSAAGYADAVAIATVLGFTRTQIGLLGARRGLVTGLAGAATGVVLAVAGSTLTPVGLARLADPSPGVRADLAVLAAGAVAIAVVAAVLGAASARRVAAVRTRTDGGRAMPLPGTPAPVLAGLHLLVRPGSGRRVSVANVTFASLCFVVAGSLAVLVTVASLDHLRVTPPLAGATWDGVIDPRADEELVTEQQLDAVLATLASDPRVADVGTSGWSEVIVNGTAVPLQVFGDGIGPATASGRAPRGPGELALGADEMRRLGVGIGDRVRIAAGPDMPAIDAEVVGQSILVAPIFRDTASGDGAATNVATMVRLGVARLDAAGLVLVRFALGADVDRELARVTEQIRGGFAFSSRDRIVVEGIERVRAVPIALVLVLALLGAAGLTHVLLVSARYRRGDLAVLRTIGFTRRQVLGAMTVQAVALAGATILAGGPVGVVGGRLAWERIAGFLRVVPDPRVPAGVVGPVAAAVVALATLVALPTGWHATRNRPARVLRAEQR